MNGVPRTALVVSAVALLCVGAASHGQVMADGWPLPPGWSIATAADAASLSRGTWVACGTGRLFDMPELAQRYLGARIARGGGYAEAGWQILGGAAWCERRVRVEAGWGRRLGAGLAWGRRGSGVEGGAFSSCQEATAVLWASLADDLRLSIRSDPLILTPDGVPDRRWPWLRLCGRRGVAAWALVLDRRRDEAPTLRAAGQARCASGLALGVLGEPGTGTLGLTTVWTRGPIVLMTSHLAHPALGLTHRWMLVLVGASR